MHGRFANIMIVFRSGKTVARSTPSASFSLEFSVFGYEEGCAWGAKFQTREVRTPAVNGFPIRRRSNRNSRNPLSCKSLVALGLTGQFSVPELLSPGTGSNRQGCERTPSFWAPNSHILRLMGPSG